MTEIPTDATTTTGLGQSANGAASLPPEPLAGVAATVGPTERAMYAIMILAGAGLLLLGLDGMFGYAITRALFPARDPGEDG